MFSLDELKEDPTLLLDLKEDVREDAEQIGQVTNVVLYDVSWHPYGSDYSYKTRLSLKA